MNPSFKRPLSLGSMFALTLTLALAGCQTTKPAASVQAPVETRSPVPIDPAAAAAATGAAVSAPVVAPMSRVSTVDLSQSPENGALASAAMRVVYFDFDSFVVKDEFRGVVEGHAKALAAERNKKLIIEGHTDERGGREYNLALGQKRAEAVARSLALLGAGSGQVEAVSFGKERPAAQGSDESAWARNRRAELKDR